MAKSKFTAEERIIYAKVMLQKEDPFLSYILMNMRLIKSNEGCPTMGVDVKGNLYYNEEFVHSLDIPTLKGVLCHEAMHIVLCSHLRQGSRNMYGWNIATDAVINYLLNKNNYQLPKDSIQPDENGNFVFINKKGKKEKIPLENNIAEYIYDKLLQEAKRCPSCDGEGVPSDGQPGDQEGGGGKNKFEHDGEQFDQHYDNQDGKKGDQNNNDEQHKDGGLSPDQKAELEQHWKKKVKEAAVHAKNRGDQSYGAYGRIIDELLEPQVDWRTVLWRFLQEVIKFDYSMRRPKSSFYTTGYYNPITIKKPSEILLAIDVSGSIGQEELTLFVSELAGIVSAFPQIDIRCLFWSTQVDPNSDQILNNDNVHKLHNIQFDSTGGTTMSCVQDYLEKDGGSAMYPVNIFLTDGFIESSPKLPEHGQNLFILSKNSSEEIVKDHGIVCKLQ